MSFRNTSVRKLPPPLSSLFIKPAHVPSLSALCIKGADIGGTSKRKANGDLAATRLGSAMTDKWANDRFRQVMLLIREFRMEWPNKSLLTADDTEFIRSAVDIALSTAGHEAHTGGLPATNPNPNPNPNPKAVALTLTLALILTPTLTPNPN